MRGRAPQKIIMHGTLAFSSLLNFSGLHRRMLLYENYLEYGPYKMHNFIIMRKSRNLRALQTRKGFP